MIINITHLLFLLCNIKKRQHINVTQYKSEADLSESHWLDCASRFEFALPISYMYVQVAILNLLNLYIQSCYRTLCELHTSFLHL